LQREVWRERKEVETNGDRRRILQSNGGNNNNQSNQRNNNPNPNPNPTLPYPTITLILQSSTKKAQQNQEKQFLKTKLN